MSDLREAYVCDAVRTPIGRFGGALAYVRTDDLAAVPIMALMARNTDADWGALDEVILGCANQAGEDNRNVARMAALLSAMLSIFAMESLSSRFEQTRIISPACNANQRKARSMWWRHLPPTVRSASRSVK